jgi:hypothetical protein
MHTKAGVAGLLVVVVYGLGHAADEELLADEPTEIPYHPEKLARRAPEVASATSGLFGPVLG